MKIKVSVTIKEGTAIVDFSGTSHQVKGNANAPLAVTQSAVYYVFRCLIGSHVPANEGGFAPINIIAPENSVVNPSWPAAVSSGNTETSQRIVDVVFGAMSHVVDVPAASQGTMNNVIIGGYDSKRKKNFSYYETIGGGTGASANSDGEHAIHSHMTNTWNTPVEALEMTYPLRILQYRIRKGSGGKGKHVGGDGLIREILALTEATVSLQTERRKIAPWGIKGGEDAKTGVNTLIRKDGRKERLPGKITFKINPGDKIIIETPGGGGYGHPNTSR